MGAKLGIRGSPGASANRLERTAPITSERHGHRGPVLSVPFPIDSSVNGTENS